MHNLLAIHSQSGFRGNKFFENGEMLRDVGIEPSIAVSDPRSDDITEVLQTYPEDEIDGILIRKVKILEAVHENGLCEDIPLFFSGGTILKGHQKQTLIDIVDSGREVYVFTGSIRAARSFYIPNDGNLQVVIAPIMGLSPNKRMQAPLIDNMGQQTYDIGFFSSMRFNKRPHRVLETANNVGEQLDYTPKVWVGGMHWDTEYSDMIRDISASDHYKHINIEHNDHIQPRTLFRKIQDTKVIYLPLLKPTETNCYAAWETISYDVPLVGSDWSSIGEAIRNSRHPLSATVPIKKVKNIEQIFSDHILNTYPDAVDEANNKAVDKGNEHILTVDEEAAQRKLLNALTTHASHQRTFEIPDRMQAESTIAAMADILNKNLTPADIETHLSAFKSNKETDSLIKSIDKDVLKTTKGYSLLRNPLIHHSTAHQTSIP